MTWLLVASRYWPSETRLSHPAACACQRSPASARAYQADVSTKIARSDRSASRSGRRGIGRVPQKRRPGRHCPGQLRRGSDLRRQDAHAAGSLVPPGVAIPPGRCGGVGPADRERRSGLGGGRSVFDEVASSAPGSMYITRPMSYTSFTTKLPRLGSQGTAADPWRWRFVGYR
jgi:hypothetical protein